MVAALALLGRELGRSGLHWQFIVIIVLMGLDLLLLLWPGVCIHRHELLVEVVESCVLFQGSLYFHSRGVRRVDRVNPELLQASLG